MFFSPLAQALQAPEITRSCTVLDDKSFVTLAILRVLENSKTGRDFIQTHGIPTLAGLTRSNYFDGLGSQCRLDMFISLERELQRQQLPTLRTHDDRLAHFSELDQIEIWAADGHHIAHATHDPRNEKGGYRPVNAIYKLDLRSGFIRFLDLVRPTARGIENEITTLKRQDKEDLRCGAVKGQSTLMVYDAAIIDFQYAYNLKQSKSIYILTAWKNNLAPLTVIPREIDHSHPTNALVINEETLYRPTEVSLQFIRWLRVSLIRPTCYRRAIEQLRPLMLTY